MTNAEDGRFCRPSSGLTARICIGPPLAVAGLPAAQVFDLALDEAEKRGHKWPVRFVVK